MYTHRGPREGLEPCFGTGLSLSLAVCQLTSEDIKQHYLPGLALLFASTHAERSHTPVNRFALIITALVEWMLKNLLCVITLKILLSTSKFGGLWKHQNIPRMLKPMGQKVSMVLTCTETIRLIRDRKKGVWRWGGEGDYVPVATLLPAE